MERLQGKIIDLKLRMKRSWRAAEKLAKAVYTEWVTYQDHLDDLDDLDDLDKLDEVNGLDNVDDLEGLYDDEDNRER